MPIDASLLARLRSQMSRGEVVLFLGAGFSVDAFDTEGRNLPTGQQLTAGLWNLAFPDEVLDQASRLPDAYYAARTQNEMGLRALLKTRLSVDAERLPAPYEEWFSVPWFRCYTLNVDDLDLATARRFALPRSVRSISATSGKTQGSPDVAALEVVHLNGSISDDLTDLTFSDADYASRLTTPDAWYVTARPI